MKEGWRGEVSRLIIGGKEGAGFTQKRNPNLPSITTNHEVQRTRFPAPSIISLIGGARGGELGENPLEVNYATLYKRCIHILLCHSQQSVQSYH